MDETKKPIVTWAEAFLVVVCLILGNLLYLCFVPSNGMEVTIDRIYFEAGGVFSPAFFLRNKPCQ